MQQSGANTISGERCSRILLGDLAVRLLFPFLAWLGSCAYSEHYLKSTSNIVKPYCPRSDPLETAAFGPPIRRSPAGAAIWICALRLVPFRAESQLGMIKRWGGELMTRDMCTLVAGICRTTSDLQDTYAIYCPPQRLAQSESVPLESK